jgi:tetratricopeptide (TPR) repeat protein
MTKVFSPSKKVSMLNKLVPAILLISAVPVAASAQELEVNRYNVTTRIDVSSSSADVRASLELSNLSQSSRSRLYLRLTKLAKVTSVTVNGAPAQFDSSDDRRVTTLSQLVINPAASIGAGATATAEIAYKIEAPESSPLIHIYPGEVFLAPEAVWVPMPYTVYTMYGAETAPMTLSVSFAGTAAGFRAASSGAVKPGSDGSTFDQTLNTLPLLVAGNFDQPMSREVNGVRVEVYTQPGITLGWADPKTGAASPAAARLIEEVEKITGFLTQTLGPAPAGATFRIISSARAGNTVVPGALVLNERVFRRDLLTTATLETLADAVAHLWIDGVVRLRGQEPSSGQDGGPARRARSAAFLRDSLPRYLAALYFEERFGKDAAREAFSRMRWSYTPVAQSGRDAELGIQTVLLPNYAAAVLAKGPLIYRLLAETCGRDKLIAAVRTLLSGPRTKIVTIEDLRAALSKAAGNEADRIFGQWVDVIVEPDIIVGAPLASDKPGFQIVNLRNLGTGDIRVQLVATTASGKQIRGAVAVPSENIVSAEIQTAEKITAVEIDPDRLIIQSNYDNDAREGDFKTTRMSAQTLFNDSIAAFNKGQFQEAEGKLKQALARDAANPLVHAWLARSFVSEKRYDEAEAEANLTLKTEPQVGSAVAWARISLGQVALAKNKPVEAVDQFRRALTDAEEAPAQFAVRELLVQAERAANLSPAVDDQVRAYVTSLDSAIKQPTSDKLFTLVVKNNLKRFVQGITVSRPSSWTTEILRVDKIDANRVALDVKLSVRAENRDQSGTAVFVLYRGGGGWMLEDVQLFNVK